MISLFRLSLDQQMTRRQNVMDDKYAALARHVSTMAAIWKSETGQNTTYINSLKRNQGNQGYSGIILT